jgi:hypothetical protein
MLVRRIVVIAVKHDFAAEVGDGAHFDLGGRQRHDDHGGDCARAGGKCDPLRVIAGGSANHAARRAGGRQLGDFVVGAADFERKHGLQVFTLEQDSILETA